MYTPLISPAETGGNDATVVSVVKKTMGYDKCTLLCRIVLALPAPALLIYFVVSKSTSSTTWRATTEKNTWCMIVTMTSLIAWCLSVGLRTEYHSEKPKMPKSDTILVELGITFLVCVANTLIVLWSSFRVRFISLLYMCLHLDWIWMIGFGCAFVVPMLLKQLVASKKEAFSGFKFHVMKKMCIAFCLPIFMIMWTENVMSNYSIDLANMPAFVHAAMAPDFSCANTTLFTLPLGDFIDCPGSEESDSWCGYDSAALACRAVAMSPTVQSFHLDVFFIILTLYYYIALGVLIHDRGMIKTTPEGGFHSSTLELLGRKNMIIGLLCCMLIVGCTLFRISRLFTNAVVLITPVPDDMAKFHFTLGHSGSCQGTCDFYFMLIELLLFGNVLFALVLELVPKFLCIDNSAHHERLAQAFVLNKEEVEILRTTVLKKREAKGIRNATIDSRYVARDLETGDRKVAGGSLVEHMRVDCSEDEFNVVIRREDKGYVEAIRSEVKNHPKSRDPLPEWDQPLDMQEDITTKRMTLDDWFHYILDEPASAREFENGIQDEGHIGWTLDDFLQHPQAKAANLNRAHVVALRLYTSKAFRYINDPLRQGRKHPMPATVMFLQEGLKKLRRNNADELRDSTSLWRGFKNLQVQQKFLDGGGTELALMSTSSDLQTAAKYSCDCGQKDEKALILKLKIDKNNFMSYGAGLKWLSVFPGEEERLFPPLTFLSPTNRIIKETVEGVKFTIVEVEPRLN